jgi:ketosteroid isomerase-like protein
VRSTSRETQVRDYYRDIDAGAIDAALTPFAAEAVYRRPGYAAMVGLEAIRRFYEDERVIASGAHELEAVVHDGEQVAVRGSFRGTSTQGAPLAVRFADFWTFADDRVIERFTYFDAAAV